MPMIKIKCPATVKDVPTGIAMDLEGFASSSFIDNGVHCPHCGEIHRWSKDDAFME